MAAAASRALRVALLECERLVEHLPPKVFLKHGGYHSMLQKTFDHVSALPSPEFDTPVPKVQLTAFDVKGQQYPDDVKSFDGVLISGSLSGVYDAEDWIQTLLQRTREYGSSGVKICGISFGHQVLAAAYGGEVGKNEKGSEVAARDVPLTKRAQQFFQTNRKSFRLMYHHNDTIKKLPRGFHAMGGNNVTQYQGLFKGDNILGFCGHPDYSHAPDVLAALLEYDREKGWVHEQLVEYGLQNLAHETDYVWVTRQIIKFYMGLLKDGDGKST